MFCSVIPLPRMRVGLLLTALVLGACGEAELEVSEAESGLLPTVAAAEPEVVPAASVLPLLERFDNGLVRETLVRGQGPAARVGDRVRVHWTGHLRASGETFETTATSGIPFSFVLGAGTVIRGWELGLDGVLKGSEIRLEVPATLAWGDVARSGVPANSDLEFELHLVDVQR